MGYFITGATGFIGGHLLERLLRRRGPIYVLIRKGSDDAYQELLTRLGTTKKRVIAVRGDITKTNLGIAPKTLSEMKGKIRHVFHLAAVYDILSEDVHLQTAVNVNGTRQAVAVAETIEAKCFHHVSSIAAAGLYPGRWSEDMFEQAERHEQPYYRTKHDAEAVVRYECRVPYRIYRPGIVVGHSKTGAITKIDGPYYFFKFLQKVRNALPPWFPLVGLEGGRVNIVPVDYVADGIDYLAHKSGLNKRCFHLTDPKPYRAGEVLNIFARAAHGPEFAMRIDARLFQFIPQAVRDSILHLPPVRRIIDTVLKDLGIPPNTMTYINYPTRFECADTLRALEGSGIRCPRLEDYAHTLWDYWERNLDPDLSRDHTLAGAVRGKLVLITGASSGIGRALARRVAVAGGRTILVARKREELLEVKNEIENAGGEAHVYPADISDPAQCEEMLANVRKDLGDVQILVNNAGRSIRRSLHLSYERFHDFERLMQVNYFGAVKLILGVLPAMEEKREGHIINVSSIGVLANSPRFSAYVASKSALDAFSRCVAPEYLDKNVKFTTINMPLVRTPMINPTSFYEHVPALKVDEAVDLICTALIDKPKRIATRLGIFAQVMTTLFPNVADVILNTAFKLFPDTSAAAGRPGDQDVEPSAEAVAFAALMRGVYW